MKKRHFLIIIESFVVVLCLLGNIVCGKGLPVYASEVEELQWLSTSINLDVQVASSMGYIRGFKDNGGGVKPHYLTFYSTFGGLNCSFGAVKTIALEIDEDDNEIYFNRPNGGYELVLAKDEETGEWIRPRK